MIGLSALSPHVGASKMHLSGINMPASLTLNTTSTYNNGRTDEQVKLEITPGMLTVRWDGEVSQLLFFREFNLAAGSLDHLGAPLPGSVKIAAPMDIPSNITGSGSSNGSQVKSGIALQDTWSKRQEGAMRPVRKAGWA